MRLRVSSPFGLLGLLATFVTAPVHAKDHQDWLIEYIEGTGVMNVLDGQTNTKPSPTTVPNEMNLALDHFADKGAAIRRLDEYRKGGRIFMGFEIGSIEKDGPSHVIAACGRTPSWSTDWETLWNASVYKSGEETAWTTLDSPGTFSNFKYASARERIYAVAQCLAKLPGMPPLKPLHPKIRSLYISDDAYKVATNWLKARDPQAVRGTDAQYKYLFRCLTTRVGDGLNGAGDLLAVRTIDFEGLPPSLMLFRTDKDGVDRVFDASDDDAEGMAGIWPEHYGLDPTGALPSAQAFLSGVLPEHERECRMKAGLFVVPPSSVTTATPAACAGQ
jgi:hypothetical protein